MRLRQKGSSGSTSPRLVFSDGRGIVRGMAQVAWHELFCRRPGCRKVFHICGSCYRGQVYCGDECRGRMRLQQKRKANQKHQDSPEGRDDHRDRQRVYREKCRLGVTDHTSPVGTRSCTIEKPSIKTAISTSGEGFQGRPRFGRPQTAIRRVCIVCGRVDTKRISLRREKR